MKIATVREFRDKVTQMFRSEEPILVLRRGEIASLYFPYPHKTFPMELKRQLFDRRAAIPSTNGFSVPIVRLPERWRA